MMAITTRSSTSVKPLASLFLVIFMVCILFCMLMSVLPNCIADIDGVIFRGIIMF